VVEYLYRRDGESVDVPVAEVTSRVTRRS